MAGLFPALCCSINNLDELVWNSTNFNGSRSFHFLPKRGNLFFRRKKIEIPFEKLLQTELMSMLSVACIRSRQSLFSRQRVALSLPLAAARVAYKPPRNSFYSREFLRHWPLDFLKHRSQVHHYRLQVVRSGGGGREIPRAHRRVRIRETDRAE